MKEARPTSGLVLSAFFNILGSESFVRDGFSFLDLFAGTGRVGLEALKRGASEVVFVETLKERARNLQVLSQDGGALVLALELRRALAWLTKRERVFDVVFADPPYNEGWGASLLAVRGLADVLHKNGIMAVEHATRESLVITEVWELTSTRSYGETTLSFFMKKVTDTAMEDTL